MKCEDIGTLRAHLDRELSDEDGRRVLLHLESCVHCRKELEQLQSTAAIVTRALAALEDLPGAEQVSAARALGQVRARLDSRERKFGPSFRRFKMIRDRLSFRYRLALAGVVSLLVLALIGLTPQGQVAASNFLAQFRAQKLKVVVVDLREMSKTIQDLSHLGDVDVSQMQSTSLTPVSSLADASQRAGFPVRQPRTLPSGISSEPAIAVKPTSTLSFTFNVAKANEYLKSIGETSFTVPAKFDGAKLSLHLPSAVLLVYGQDSSKQLFIGQSGIPSGNVSGNVTPLEMRELLLRTPGLSQETIAQLKAIDDWTNTLPIPLPRDQATWREVDLGGVKALVVGDNTGLGGFVIWQQNDIIYGVGGPFTEQELLTVARSLR